MLSLTADLAMSRPRRGSDPQAVPWSFGVPRSGRPPAPRSGAMRRRPDQYAARPAYLNGSIGGVFVGLNGAPAQ